MMSEVIDQDVFFFLSRIISAVPASIVKCKFACPLAVPVHKSSFASIGLLGFCVQTADNCNRVCISRVTYQKGG